MAGSYQRKVDRIKMRGEKMTIQNHSKLSMREVSVIQVSALSLFFITTNEDFSGKVNGKASCKNHMLSPYKENLESHFSGFLVDAWPF